MSTPYGPVFVKEDIIGHSDLVVVAFIVGVIDGEIWPRIADFLAWIATVATDLGIGTEVPAWGLFASLDSPCWVAWGLVLRLAEEPHGLGCHREWYTSSIEPVVHLLIRHR